MIAEWPFDQERNCAVFTVREVLEDGGPILHVTHDLEDHGWQFLSKNDAKLEEAKIVALEEIVKMDPSMLELADLKPGWHAWRESINHAWQRAPKDVA